MGEVAAVDPKAPDGSVIRRAAEILQAGGLVAFPTETVYGLGANGLDPAAIGRIYAAKGRPSNNPLILHVSSNGGARLLAADWPPEAQILADAFWPGPLTLVLPKAAVVPSEATGGGATVAVRCPAHPIALALIEAAGLPLAAPSANRSTEISPTRAEHVFKSLGDRVDLILDAGPTGLGIESTVVDLTRKPIRILRFGPLPPVALRELLDQEIVWGPSIQPAGAALPSPGLLARHYAPETPVRLCESDAELRSALNTHREAGRKAGAMAFEIGEGNRGPSVRSMPAEAGEYAAALYGTLHELDGLGLAEILILMPPDGESWLAVRDRLRRAAFR